MGYAAPAIAQRSNGSTAFAYKCSAMIIDCANCKLRYLR
jgi:hypothetical protein